MMQLIAQDFFFNESAFSTNVSLIKIERVGPMIAYAIESICLLRVGSEKYFSIEPQAFPEQSNFEP